MPKAPFADLLHYLRHLYPADAGGNSADGELLNRFISAHDEDAFTALVHRHGSMVLSVCQRLLGDRHLAEDSFQATFIVLARRAATIRSRTSLGTWLYAVAQRVALKAKGKTAAWRNRERQSGTMTSGHQLNEHTWQELRSILDEEIARLPEKYQAPLVLCYLEAKSHDRAAKELGCAKTTLERRLSRGRELLRLRLIRRGVTLSAAALATTLGDKAMAVPVGVSLTINTVKAAIDVIAGKALADGFLAARAVVLAEEAMVGMAGVKGKLVLLVLVVGLAIGGAGWACYGALGETSQPAEATHAQPPDTKQAGSPTKTPVLKDQYGDPLPEGAVARLGAQRFRHEGGPGWVVRALAFTPDGKTLIGPTEAGVLVWDATTGKELLSLLTPTGTAYRVAFSPDGSRLVVQDQDSTTQIYVLTIADLAALAKSRLTRTFTIEECQQYLHTDVCPAD